MNITEFQHIIWDWNGTLFNDVNLCVDIINGVLKRRNLPQVTVEKYKSIFTIPVENYYSALGFDFSVEPFEKVGKEWMDEYEKRKFESALSDGALDVLNYLKNKGIKQSILSAYKQDTLDKIIDHFKIREFFEHVIGLDHIYATSKLELGLELIKSIDTPPEKTLLIGDTVHDCEVAKKIGAKSMLLASGHQSREKLSRCGVPLFNSLTDLMNNR